jgi:hypothetical protein
MSKKGEPLGRTYDELKFVDVLKKRYSEANNTLGSVARLRLVVCKDHQRSINKKNLVPKVIEKQAGPWDDV